MKKYFVLLLVLLGYFTSRANAATITLDSSSTLRIYFTSDPIVTPCPGTCDVLRLSLVLDAPELPGTLVTAKLYNSGILLATTTEDPALGPNFRSSTSLYALGTVIDFTALQGPFSGYYDVTATNTLTIDSSDTNVNLMHATSGFGASYYPGTAYITSITLVPEPKYTGLLCVLLSGVVIRRLIRSNRCAK